MRYCSFLLAVMLFSLPLNAQKVLHLDRYAAANAALPPAAGSRVVLLGDSITDSWASQRPDFFRDNGFVGRGISGEVTAQMLLRFRADVLDISATTVVILGGINDIAQNLGDNYNEAATLDNLKSMADLARRHGVRPILCSLLPSTHFFWRPEMDGIREKVLSLNARIRAYCAAEGLPYLDYASALAGPEGPILPDYAPDTVHPSAAGYALMERLLLRSL